MVRSSQGHQHFQYIGQNPTWVHMMRSPSVNSRGWFGVGLFWNLGRFKPSLLYFLSEYNVRKNNKNKLFPTVLRWFYLAVTLKWPYHDLQIKPIWNQTPTDFTTAEWDRVNMLISKYRHGSDCHRIDTSQFPVDVTIVYLGWVPSKLFEVLVQYSILNRFELIWPWCDLEMTLPWSWDNSHMKHSTNPCHHAYLDYYTHLHVRVKDTILCCPLVTL